jgi:hypothetical protein
MFENGRVLASFQTGRRCYTQSVINAGSDPLALSELPLREIATGIENKPPRSRVIAPCETERMR